MSTMNNAHGLIIFAVNTTEDDKEYSNLKATLRYNGLGPDTLMAAEGCYKGEQEQSYVYPFSFTAWKVIKALCIAHKQESILHVMPNWACMLRIMSPEDDMYLGVFTGVSCATAQQAGAYTKINNQYFITVNQGE